MITDHIRNRALYYGLGERYRTALDYFATFDEQHPEKADIILDGDNVFVKIRPMLTKKPEECSFEAHKSYADIHYVAYGIEKIGYADIQNLKTISCDEEKDAATLSGKGDFIKLKEGYFMIVLPDDAHMPCVCSRKPSEISKLIAKIKL